LTKEQKYDILRPDWISYFMNMVYLVATRSPDNYTHIGAVIIDIDTKSIISTGYNGFPKGVEHKPERQERPEKYYWFAHAEQNAIDLSTKPLKNCAMFTNGIPCTKCARSIIQSGICSVFYDRNWGDHSHSFHDWDEEAKRSVQMFREANVALYDVDFNFISVYKYKNGNFRKELNVKRR
jgi:dCMP deaminase